MAQWSDKVTIPCQTSNYYTCFPTIHGWTYVTGLDNCGPLFLLEIFVSHVLESWILLVEASVTFHDSKSWEFLFDACLQSKFSYNSQGSRNSFNHLRSDFCFMILPDARNCIFCGFILLFRHCRMQVYLVSTAGCFEKLWCMKLANKLRNPVLWVYAGFYTVYYKDIQPEVALCLSGPCCRPQSLALTSLTRRSAPVRPSQQAAMTWAPCLDHLQGLRCFSTI